MKKLRLNLKRLDVRQKISLAAVVSALVFFILTTPLVTWSISLIARPVLPSDLTITQEGNNLNIQWLNEDNPLDIDNLEIVIGENTETVEIEEEVFTKTLEQLPVELNIRSVDLFGQKSNTYTKTIEESETSAPRITRVESTFIISQTTGFTLLRAITLTVIISILTFYIFGFKLRNIQAGLLSFYPGLVSFPFLLVSISYLVEGEEAGVLKFIFSLLGSILFFFLEYFILLTVNILNVSLEQTLPLEQAAKASQFIFSLIATYLILIIFFGSELSFIQKTVVILPFVFYYTISALQMLVGVSIEQAAARSSAIILVIFMAIFVFSIWPSNSYVYPILSIAVCYYILLSIALEVRKFLGKYFWVEYAALIFLISLLMLVNSSWGINGTLI